MIGTPDRKWTNNTLKNSKRYIYWQTQNTNMWYCAILMFQWNQQKSFIDLIKKFLQIKVSQLLVSLKIIVNNTDQN